MYLAGSVSEFKGIFMAAQDLRADAIHFLAPNLIFILARNKEDYLFVESGIVIGQSILVPRTSYQNMNLYLKTAREGFSLKSSMFYGEPVTSALFTSDHVYFNEGNELVVETEMASAPLKKEVEFKTKETLKTFVDWGRPYLKIPFEGIVALKSEMSKYKKRFPSKAGNSSDNAIRIEDGQVILYFHHDGQLVRIETDWYEYVEGRRREETIYPFSDKALYLLVWLARTTIIKDVFFLPREHYCLIEGYSSEMVAKVRTVLKNDILDKIM